jgi:CDP-diacylglycerol---glycerol-3-phosphate 3-phosphatidyltransferase
MSVPVENGTKPTSEPAVERSRRMWAAAFNLPNQLTYLRIVLAIVMFCTITWGFYLAATVLFILAAGTDWLDGYFARKFGQITTLGRILDPFADKVIICGTFIFLVAVPGMRDLTWGLRPWMVVVVVGRELLVTALRSFIEEQGFDFSATWSGKLKMILQCITAPAWLVYFFCRHDLGLAADAVPAWILWTAGISLWAAVIQTVYSGLIYVFAAVRMVRGNP